MFGNLGNLGNLADMLRQAGKIRESMERATAELGQKEVEAESGGGAVRVRCNGRLELVSLRIEPSLVAGGDAELIEELVSAAINSGLERAREEAAKTMQEATGLGNLPGLDQLFGGGRP